MPLQSSRCWGQLDNAIRSQWGEEVPAQGPKFTVAPKQKRGGGEQGRNMKSYQSIQTTWHVRNHVAKKEGIISWQQHATQTTEQYCPCAGTCSLPPSNPGMPHFPLEKSCSSRTEMLCPVSCPLRKAVPLSADSVRIKFRTSSRCHKIAKYVHPNSTHFSTSVMEQL